MLPDVDRALLAALSEALAQQMDVAVLYGNLSTTSSGYTLGQARELSWATIRAAWESMISDRRTLVVHADDVGQLVGTLGPDWSLVADPGHGPTAYWLRARSPHYRIRLYASRFVERGQGFLIDPDAPPRPIAVGQMLTTVTALALAAVDEALG